MDELQTFLEEKMTSLDVAKEVPEETEDFHPDSE
jgi:hypothetical protein